MGLVSALPAEPAAQVAKGESGRWEGRTRPWDLGKNMDLASESLLPSCSLCGGGSGQGPVTCSPLLMHIERFLLALTTATQDGRVILSHQGN